MAHFSFCLVTLYFFFPIGLSITITLMKSALDYLSHLFLSFPRHCIGIDIRLPFWVLGWGFSTQGWVRRDYGG
jgi:hypothetical protein